MNPQCKSYVFVTQYNKLTYGGEVEEGENEAAYHITTISADEFKPFYAAEKGQFDFVFSMSSLDHDGVSCTSFQMLHNYFS